LKKTLSQIIEFNAREVAEQLTQIEQTYFRAIKRVELLNGYWGKETNNNKVPNMMNFIKHNEKIRRWVVTEVLKYGTEKTRINCISFFINVAIELEMLKNFSSVMTIVGALHCPAILKLKNTWNLLSKKDRDTLDKLCEIMNNIGHYKQYFTIIKEISNVEPCIPAVSIVCEDIVKVHEILDTYVDNKKEWMNWQKLSTIGNIVQGAIRFSQPFYFRVDNLIQNTILGCEIWDDDDISWEIAKLRESAEDLPTVDAYTRTEDLWLTKLTERDWKVILTGSVVENYKKNGIILEQGDPNSYLYLIKSGTVRVEKDTDDGTKIFTTLEKGDTFGEVSLVVKEGRTSMRCVADSEVEVNKIQISLVIEICQQSPKISQSLHYLIAFKLAQKLKSFNNSTEKLTEVKRNKEPKNQEKKEKELTGVNSDDKFYKLFKIENEVVVQEYSCQLKGKVKSPGTVYITPKYICFSSNNFGYKIREVLSFNLINKIKKQNNKIIIDIKDLPKPIILTGFESINDTCKVMKDIWKKICSVDSNTNDSHVDSMPSPLIDKTIDIPPTTDEITKILNGSKITKYKKRGCFD